ncbi:hypothetical protein GPECTOR_1249g507 [Gonium pectorale]|uniref:Uncharacterized protein n=1 Tax=Gonium pectorale TaxID=33097 RepID=A0A150FUT0_GONPE|nr:hypothetical protein GPECTOR_1249g507 [Gonium pectorale]|eukprot:KXZ40935.1 hypothetical protein GPECTOR_1249g507 [Gonium pectorale]
MAALQQEWPGAEEELLNDAIAVLDCLLEEVGCQEAVNSPHQQQQQQVLYPRDIDLAQGADP